MSTNETIRAPIKALSDIFIPATDAQNDAINTGNKNSSSAPLNNEPSLILGDWLYLGNRWHAKSRDVMEKLQITHILNITATIPCSFPDIIQYAQIKVYDESTVKLYDYFEAAATYIDLCNPLNYDISQEPMKRKRRILVHCAMGISRSATITIAYLMSRANILNKSEQKLLDHIQTNLEELDEEIETEINENNVNGWSPKIFEHHRENKDWTKRERKKYQKVSTQNGEYENGDNHHHQGLPLSTDDEKVTNGHNVDDNEIKEEGGNKDTVSIFETNDEASKTDTNGVKDNESRDKICNGMTLGEAYLFVLERRNIICPNVGFCQQLEMWEKYVWDYNESTLYQIPFFRPDLNGKPKKKDKNKTYDGDGDDNPQCSGECCIIL